MTCHTADGGALLFLYFQSGPQQGWQLYSAFMLFPSLSVDAYNLGCHSSSIPLALGPAGCLWENKDLFLSLPADFQGCHMRTLVHALTLHSARGDSHWHAGRERTSFHSPAHCRSWYLPPVSGSHASNAQSTAINLPESPLLLLPKPNMLLMCCCLTRPAPLLSPFTIHQAFIASLLYFPQHVHKNQFSEQHGHAAFQQDKQQIVPEYTASGRSSSKKRKVIARIRFFQYARK